MVCRVGQCDPYNKTTNFIYIKPPQPPHKYLDLVEKPNTTILLDYRGTCKISQWVMIIFC